MDSTPNQTKIVPRKLPIKRKSPDNNNNQGQEPPFKFHRVWTELDEIRFLQGLVDSAPQGLIFPRDLHIFFNRFSQSTSRIYTLSQLSEKLRRLRKKFRVISGRISRGLDSSLLTPHDQSLFHLSQQLWHPDYASTSPFKKSDRVRVRVSFNPTFTPPPAIPTSNVVDDENLDGEDEDEEEENVPLTGAQIGRIAAKAVVHVFEASVNDVKSGLALQGLIGKHADFMTRRREQSLLELDVFACRLRLVAENCSVNNQ